jgi:hypothetical protein
VLAETHCRVSGGLQYNGGQVLSCGPSGACVRRRDVTTYRSRGYLRMWFEEVGRGFQSSHAFGKGMWSRALAHRMCQLIAFGEFFVLHCLERRTLCVQRATCRKPRAINCFKAVRGDVLLITRARRDTAVPPMCIVMTFCSLTSAACELRCWPF